MVGSYAHGTVAMQAYKYSPKFSRLANEGGSVEFKYYKNLIILVVCIWFIPSLWERVYCTGGLWCVVNCT